MNILIIDVKNSALSFAWRCALAGHSVRWFTKNSDVGRGFRGVEKIANWVASMSWAELVFVTDSSEYIERLEFFRLRGSKILGPSVDSCDVIAEVEGINVPSKTSFSSATEASSYVRKQEGDYVAISKNNVFKSSSSADMLNWLSRTDPVGELTLQDRVDGCHVNVSRWMGSEGWVGPVYEHTSLGSDVLGGFTTSSKLFKDTLGLLETTLKDLKHTGIATLSAVVDAAGKVWCLKVRTTPSWPLFALMHGANKGDPAIWMLDALNGTDSTTFCEDNGVSITLHCEEMSVPIYGVTRGNKKHLHPIGAKINVLNDMDGDKIVERHMWNTHGKNSVVVTGYGKDAKQSFHRASKTVSQLSIHRSCHEDFVVEEVAKNLSGLHKHGYAMNLNYEVNP